MAPSKLILSVSWGVQHPRVKGLEKVQEGPAGCTIAKWRFIQKETFLGHRNRKVGHPKTGRGESPKTGRSSKSTKVGDIMTEENKLITVTPETKVLQAMQLMTENRIRHIPVIEEKGMVGMVSIGDVVRAVVTEHKEELSRLNAYIQGGY